MSKFVIASLLLIIISGAIGCGTRAVPMNMQVGGTTASSPQNGEVALVVTPELKAASWDFLKCGNDCAIALGEPIIHYSKQLLGGFYKDVKVLNSVGVGAEAQLFITPTLRHIERGTGGLAGARMVANMGIEWRVIDQSGKTIFLDTIVGEGVGTMGNAFTFNAHFNDVLGKMFDDIFTRSRSRLSPVLLRYSNTVTDLSSK